MKISKLLFLAIAVFFLSCGDDDKDPVPTGDGLAGSWTATAVDYSGTSTTKYMGETLGDATFTGTGKDMDLTLTFNENPNTYVSKGSYTIALKTTMAGMTTNEDRKIEEFMLPGTWAQDGKKLTITSTANGQTQTQEATIVEQTATTLKIQWDVVINEEDYQGVEGMDLSNNTRGTYTFKRK
jgi:hypothetical protein